MTKRWLKSVSRELQQPSGRQSRLKSMRRPLWGSGTPAWNITWGPLGKMKTLPMQKLHLISWVAFYRYVYVQHLAIWYWLGSLVEHMVSLNQEPVVSVVFRYCKKNHNPSIAKLSSLVVNKLRWFYWTPIQQDILWGIQSKPAVVYLERQDMYI